MKIKIKGIVNATCPKIQGPILQIMQLIKQKKTQKALASVKKI